MRSAAWIFTPARGRILRGLVGQLNEAASIGVLDSSHAVYIERVQAGLVRLGVNVRLGSRIPAYCTALGHSILAYLPFERRVGILNMQETAGAHDQQHDGLEYGSGGPA